MVSHRLVGLQSWKEPLTRYKQSWVPAWPRVMSVCPRQRLPGFGWPTREGSAWCCSDPDSQSLVFYLSALIYALGVS